MSNESTIGMHRLNPTHKVDDEVYMGFFPPIDDYYTDLLQDKRFEKFLMSDGTTKEGQDRIADFYQVAILWEQMEKSECNYDQYFQLLMLVNTYSIADYLWVSFVEGLHRHAATILALLCWIRNHDSCEKSATETENTGIRRIPAGIGNLDGKCSIVTKLKPHREVTKNGKPFTNITSTTNITYLCSCTKSRGICTY